MSDFEFETQKKKSKNDFTTKALLASMGILVAIILIIIAMLYIIKNNTVILTVDGMSKEFSDRFIIKKEDNISYINIKEMCELLNVQYHSGEYKIFSSDKDKCYIQSDVETASFYLNSDKVNKLKVEDYESDYEICECSTNTIQIDGEFYAPVDAIETAFNISLSLKDKKIEIITLQNLVQIINNNINKNKTYKSLEEEEFNNQKALLYGYIIAAKTDSNLYSVMNLDASKEIISDRYKKITFIESTKEFLVTNSLDKVGIIDKDGQNIIEQLYDSIKIISNNPKMYMVETDKKFGVLDAEGKTIIHSEYDKIGLENYSDLKNQYILLDNIIPVQKDKKCGLFDIKGNKVLDIKYDQIGCNLTTVQLENTSKSVSPLVEIEECSGIVVKDGTTYDLFLTKNNEMISLKVESMYYIKEGGKTIYYMIYKGQEMNLIENLTKLGYIKSDKDEDQEKNDTIEQNTNIMSNNILSNNIVGNQITNKAVGLLNVTTEQ